MRQILIVDDNEAFAENIAEILADAGVAEPTVATSGERALAELAARRFDAMVTDMRMPVMNGAELIQRARRIDPQLPVVVMTAFTVDAQLEHATREGVLSVLAKPAPIAHLIELLERAQRRLVAIVDDDVSLTDNLVELLRRRGMTAVVARTVGEAEQISGVPNVALVDLRVPGGADGAAIERLLARFPGLPVVVVTALRERVSLPPTVPVVEKPFDPLELLDTLERYCAPTRGPGGEPRPMRG